jgi:hypothetical protein
MSTCNWVNKRFFRLLLGSLTIFRYIDKLVHHVNSNEVGHVSIHNISFEKLKRKVHIILAIPFFLLILL